MIGPIPTGALLATSAVLFVLEVLFIVHLQRLLERVRPENRTMAPGLVWLEIIPLFGFFWFLYVVQKIRDSLRKEYQARQWPHTGDFALNIGVAAGVLRVVAFAVGLAPLEYEIMSWVILGGWIVCWFIYWARTAVFKNRLGPSAWAMPGVFAVTTSQMPSDGGETARDDESDDESDDELDGDVDSDEPVDEADDPLSSIEDPLCPACGATVKPYDRYCHICGSRLPWDH